MRESRYLFALAFLLLFVPEARAQRSVAFKREVYAARRARLIEETGSATIVIPGAYLIHADGERQDPTFWYLTGVESPYAILVMSKGATGEAREALFLPDQFQFAGAQNPNEDPRFRNAPWNRPILRLAPGPQAAEVTGIALTYALSDFAKILPALAPAEAQLYVAHDSPLYAPPGLAPPLSLREQTNRSVLTLLGRNEARDLTPLVDRMRLVKDRDEVAALRRAASISARSFLDVLKTLRPGMNDLEVAGLMEYAWKKAGSPRSSNGPIVSSGQAAISLFTLKAEKYHSTDHVIGADDLVFIDYGAAESDMYASDVCRTYPASGRFTAEQRKYYDIVLEAQLAAIASVKAGVMMVDVVRAAAEVYLKHGLAQNEDIDRMGIDRVFGVMPSPTHYLLQGKGLTPYSAMGTGVRDLGHHIGLRATDSRDYGEPLRAGMVITIEPKLYIPQSRIAIMIEDMILVTETGSENLSKDAPKSAAEIEARMSRKSVRPL